MKGALKAVKRAPHLLTSKVGMATKSQDAEVNELVRKFAGLEDYTGKLLKDCSTFRTGIAGMLTSQAGFGTAFATLFQPIGDEVSLGSKYPDAANTLRNIASYQDLMSHLRDSIQPELDLIDSRVIAPLREYDALLKKIRKTITKREHKLVDYDRFNNSYSKLKDKKEKSLSDEKSLFKLEQDLEIAAQEYEHFNNALKSEIPHFLQLTTAFITPIFQTFYFIKVGILYTMLEQLQTQSNQFGDLSVEGLESLHYERLGNTIDRLDALTVTKRSAGSARLLQQRRQTSGSETSSIRSSGALGRKTSTTSSLPPSRFTAGTTAGIPAMDPAPPAYTAGGSTTASVGKRPPPPPPNKPRIPAVTYVTALYDYAATAEGDLSFSAGEKIELVSKTESTEDWWTGKLHGQQGVFPGNYVQL